ncbi:hypothetical protein PDESU_04457 [Pontiella desulfatans]|uniref:Uncharacterized protein n=1 Tax=Pontiella desulfatans TaxID=2750659 RepID=A0A6C2U780_PONDE|nr:hypothetical protein [Pontiella desulfatans]VGO15870.1 hypothetical protein PDESU_04457 [Pontiella desulfatans]
MRDICAMYFARVVFVITVIQGYAFKVVIVVMMVMSRMRQKLRHARNCKYQT